MADKPIIFSGPMIRALLDGRKTQTRRVLNPQPDTTSDPSGAGEWGALNRYGYWCPASSLRPYAPRDRLWVREAFSGPYNCDGIPPSKWLPDTYKTPADRAREAQNYIWRWADGNPTYGDWTRPKPSIHMPRWASRLTLTVTDVRVQRLQDISTRDCIAEGISADLAQAMEAAGRSDLAQRHALHDTYVYGYRSLWNSLHGPDAWDANPWVAAISFTVQRGNIDGATP
jgi:hypothetical protein